MADSPPPIIHRPALVLWRELLRQVSQCFRRADKQKSFRRENLADSLKHAPPRVNGKVDQHVAAKDDVKRANSTKWLEQVLLLKSHQGSNLVADLPVVSNRVEEPTQVLGLKTTLILVGPITA